MELSRPLQGHHRADVLVLGGGLTGCAAALELARRGQSVLVLEEDAGARALSPDHFVSGPGLIYTQAVARWGREGARELWEAQREEQHRLRELLEELDDDCGHRAQGGFVTAEGRDQGSALADSEDLLREDGFSGEFLDSYMLETRFEVRGFTAAYWAAEEADVDGARLARALAGAAARAGARLHAGPIGHLELAAGGGRALMPQGTAQASSVLVVSAVAASRLFPFFAGRLAACAQRRMVFQRAPAKPLPSPARTAAGEVGWRAEGDRLAVNALGPAADRVARFVADRFPALSGRVLEDRVVGGAVSADGLPWIGALPGLPAAAAIASGLLQPYALSAARWAAQALLTGRDPTPARLRAARTAQA